MEICNGLVDGMVLQRNGRNVCDVEVAGTCGIGGPVSAVVSGKGIGAGKREFKRIGVAGGGRFKARLSGIPAGGPYEIRLRTDGSSGETESVLVKDVLVGDVWILGGQSNMQGCGLRHNPLKPHPMVRCFYMDDKWRPAKEILHNMWECVDQAHVDICGGTRPAKPGPKWGTGPGVSFGQQMYKYLKVPQGLLACAHGGTSMSQWDPRLKSKGSSSLYGAMMRRIRKNGGRVAGMIWYQGCSDANAAAAPLYTKRMKEFVSHLRRDCGDPALPVAMVQIARVSTWERSACVHWNSIQDQQRRLPEHIGNLAVVPAIDLELDDCIHIGEEGQKRLGLRLARAMNVLREGRKAGLPPITLKKTTYTHVPCSITVEFANVEGGLKAAGRPWGFEVVGGGSASGIYDVKLKGNKALIRFSIQANTTRFKLHYGYGTNPYCNITDGADRSLPVFGPVEFGKGEGATMDFIRRLHVSAFQPSAGKLHGLKPPDGLDTLVSPREFPDSFCSMRTEIAARPGEDLVLWYVLRFRCPEPMRLAALVGYDGPFKAWIDGRLLLHDPKGTNPAVPDSKTLRFAAARGEHRLAMALGTNGGRAWGIFITLQRFDIPRKILLRDDPSLYRMPEIL